MSAGEFKAERDEEQPPASPSLPSAPPPCGAARGWAAGGRRSLGNESSAERAGAWLAWPLIYE